MMLPTSQSRRGCWATALCSAGGVAACRQHHVDFYSLGLMVPGASESCNNAFMGSTALVCAAGVLGGRPCHTDLAPHLLVMSRATTNACPHHRHQQQPYWSHSVPRLSPFEPRVYQHPQHLEGRKRIIIRRKKRDNTSRISSQAQQVLRPVAAQPASRAVGGLTLLTAIFSTVVCALGSG